MPAHTVFLTKTADKAQRKLDKPLRMLIRDALVRLSGDPASYGEQLTSPLSQVFSHHICYQGREFRVAYKIDGDSHSVMVLLIGPHENFYKRLKRLLYAS